MSDRRLPPPSTGRLPTGVSVEAVRRQLERILGHRDFEATGLKIPSVVRIGRLAVVGDELLEGAIGAVGNDRLKRIRARLQRWIGTGD